MPGLFDPFEVRGLRLKNRIMMSSMNQWSAGEDAVPTDYHFVHFGSRAIGGVGLIFTDGTSIVPNARTSPQDIGIWNDDQVKAFARITKFCQSWGSAMGLQLCYMGRKKHHERGPDYQPRFIAPSAIPFDEDHETPHALTKAEIVEITGQFAAAAGRVVKAGFNVVELQACHGYLISSFISPLSNKRNDEYGGSLKNRTRFGCEVLEAIRATVGDDVPVFARFSATDMVEGGNTVKENVEVARMFKAAGADVMHVSIGGTAPGVQYGSQADLHPGYIIPYSEIIRREAQVPTVTVGVIKSPLMAEEAIRNGRADLVAIGRALLSDPYWPLRAAKELDVDLEWPKPIQAAKLW